MKNEQGLSELGYAMGGSIEMLYWEKCVEVSKQLVQNSSGGEV